ncbi:hypothetical protein LUZ60_010986 [Juncus effusus]|nr:hypothetical protein LUZ60_010986 [Juncus effusus]
MLSHLVYHSLSSPPPPRRKFAGNCLRLPRLRRMNPSVAAISPETTLLYDVGVSAVASSVALGLLRFFEELAKRGVFEQKLNRKLVHISVGLVFLLFWPLFSSANYAPFLAALAPAMNTIRMLLMGFGILKNEAMVQSITRFGNYRELLKGPFYYGLTITLATCVLWRNNPVSIALVCNLCAGDGVADIMGRRFGSQKLFHNPNKSYIGTISMALVGFFASIGYLHYFSLFGLMQESWSVILGFFVVSVSAAFVESLPISTDLDDNLTVPLTSFLVGCFVL